MLKLTKKSTILLIFTVNILLGVVIATAFFYRDAGGLDYMVSAEERPITEDELSGLGLQHIYNKIADKCIPAVVSLQVTTLTVMDQNPWADFFGNDDFFRRFFGMPREKQERRGQSFGSGFVITKDGYLISNNHVVENAEKIIVKFKDSDKEYEAEVVGTDPDSDVALLKIKENGPFPALVLGQSENVKIGDIAVAIGNPFGLTHTFTTGVISAKGRTGLGPKYENFLQTDVAINPGNSGGPLINIYGEVIGVNSMIYSQSGGNIGLGFAIPIDMVKDIVDQLKKTGKVERGWLGVSIQDLDADQAEVLDIPKKGVYIPEVVKGSPAEKAGIKAGDVIQVYNGKEIKDSNDLKNKVAATKPGSKVKVELLRKGKKMELTIKIEESSSVQKTDTAIGKLSEKYLGIQVSDMPAEMQEQYGLSQSEGVVIQTIDEKSPFLGKEVRKGDFIVRIAKEDCHNIADFNRIMERVHKKPVIAFYIQRGNYLRLVVIRQ